MLGYAGLNSNLPVELKTEVVEYNIHGVEKATKALFIQTPTQASIFLT
jgi:hypothetical protein